MEPCRTTIAAIATPPGVGGIAVVRLSGSDAQAIAARHVGLPAQGRTTVHTLFRVSSGEVLDEVVVILFRAPHSYTGEDIVEFSCHGSPYVQQALLKALLDSGARLAEPGEFTLRAFKAGKLNLSQAEAVADLTSATTQAQHQLAISQLRGGYALKLKELRQQLLELTSLLELELDFSQEDVEFADRGRLSSLVEEISLSVNNLRKSFHMGNALKRGIPIAIIGRPNAGKSSLLNTLIHDDRAIVSAIPGTTRDTIEETFAIDGTLFRLIDTAGLRESDDALEQMGIRRTLSAVAHADIILYVHDATQPFVQAIDDLQQLQDTIDIKDKHLYVVYNKIDLLDGPLPEYAAFPLSAKTGEGIDKLLSQLATLNTRLSKPDVLLTNVRHYEALGQVDRALLQVAKGLDEGLPADLVAIDLRDALYHLGTITGEVTTDEILGNIFSRFCIGK